MDTNLIASFLLPILTYVIGSIPTAVWVGKRFYGIDVREHGSKNAGATNTFRVLGKKAGIPVLLIDVLKGWLPVFLFPKLIDMDQVMVTYISYNLIIGICSVIGHILPIFANFKGGKGVATLTGVVVALHPEAAGLSFVVFAIVFLSSGFISLGSMIGGICFPLFIIVWFKETSVTLVAFSLVIAVLLLITHRKNIGRLVRGEESKMSLMKK